MNIGSVGEDAAASFLEQKGYAILERNWRFKHLEVDLIVRPALGLLVFCEVKTRSTVYFGTPDQFISKVKQKRLIRAANAYVNFHRLTDEVRFDVLGVVPTAQEYQVNHIENAFYPEVGPFH